MTVFARGRFCVLLVRESHGLQLGFNVSRIISMVAGDLYVSIVFDGTIHCAIER